MKNIFEGAKFGDKFINIKNEICIFIGKSFEYEDAVRIMYEDGTQTLEYDLDGNWVINGKAEYTVYSIKDKC